MSAQADTNCHDIFNVVSATRTHLAKIGATCHVVPTCHNMSATFPAKGYDLGSVWSGSGSGSGSSATVRWRRQLGGGCGGGGSAAVAHSATAAGDGRGEGECDGNQRHRTRGWHSERTERGNASTSSRLVDKSAASISCIICWRT